MEPAIKWSGSKRTQASQLVNLFPKFDCYYEPFLGGASILYTANPKISICGDICKPLIQLYKLIQSSPLDIISEYSKRWEKLKEEGHEFYYKIRERFNKEHDPQDFLFLTRTCVNGLIRFNDKGEFNNSLHHTRNGIHPVKFEKIIKNWSLRLKNAKFIHGNYKYSTKTVSEKDFIYLDPPYYYNKDRYYGNINFGEFLNYLEDLNSRSIKYMLSFDGIVGKNNRIIAIPRHLYKKHLLLKSGNSSFKKVIDKEIHHVYESVYINYDLKQNLDDYL